MSEIRQAGKNKLHKLFGGRIRREAIHPFLCANRPLCDRRGIAFERKLLIVLAKELAVMTHSMGPRLFADARMAGLRSTVDSLRGAGDIMSCLVE
jgi:hypothetical protein